MARLHLPILRHTALRATVAAALAVATLGACRRDTPTRIGVAGPFSQPRGRSMLAAARLAVSEINAAGGLRLELVERDDSAQNSRAIQIAQEFYDDPGIVAVVGHLTSGTTIAAAGVYNGGKRPLVAISPSASNPELSGIGRFTFRVCATDLVHGTVLARYAFQKLGARFAAIIYLNDDYGRGLLGTFSEEFRRLGGTVVSQDPVLGPTTDVSPYLDLLRRDGRTQVLLSATDRTTGAAVLRAARARGLTMPIVGGDGLSGIQSEGAIAEGVYVTSNYLPERAGEANAAFLRAYGAANPGELPDHRGAGAYDAVRLIAEAVRASGSSRARVRDALAAVGSDRPAFEGVTGRIAFDDQGDVRDKTVLVGVVRGGRLTLAEAQP